MRSLWWSDVGFFVDEINHEEWILTDGTILYGRVVPTVRRGEPAYQAHYRWGKGAKYFLEVKKTAEAARDSVSARLVADQPNWKVNAKILDDRDLDLRVHIPGARRMISVDPWIFGQWQEFIEFDISLGNWRLREELDIEDIAHLLI